MTEKRFVFDSEVGFIDYEKCGGDTLPNKKVAELLNNYAEEIEQLKQQIEICKDANTRCCNEYSAMRKELLKYKKENEQLKEGLDYFKSKNDSLKTIIFELKKSEKEAWDLIKYIYNEIKNDGSMDYDRIQDLVEFE